MMRLAAIVAVIGAALALPAALGAQSAPAPTPAGKAPATSSASAPRLSATLGPGQPAGGATAPSRVIHRRSARASSDPGVAIKDGNAQSDYRFSPGTITISSGETVTWTNVGTVPVGHTVSGDGFVSKTLHHGDSYSHKFSSSGTFSYICSIHPFMKGKVVVRSSSSGGSSGGGGGGSSSGGGGGGSSSSSGNTGTSSSSSSAASSGSGSSSATGSGGSLPSTGLDLPLLAELGLVLLLAGLVLRELLARSAGRSGLDSGGNAD